LHCVAAGVAPQLCYSQKSLFLQVITNESR